MKVFKRLMVNVLVLGILLGGYGLFKSKEVYANSRTLTYTKTHTWLDQDNKLGYLLNPDTKLIPKTARKELFNVVLVSSPHTGKPLGKVRATSLRNNAYITSRVNFRTEPSVSKGRIMTKLEGGTNVLVMGNLFGSTKTWRQVIYNGQIGYVSNTYILEPSKYVDDFPIYA